MLKVKWEEHVPYRTYILLRDYFSVALTLICNKLFLYLVSVFGRLLITL